MRLKREDLEKLALETVSAELYYDLADNIDSTTDLDLYNIIECDGDYRKEVCMVNFTNIDFKLLDKYIKRVGVQ